MRADHTLDANPVQLGAFLKSRPRFEVPHYQRNFAWTASNVDQLWQDLMSTLDPDTDTYFLGSMVFVRKEGSALEVVDGQQRLSCLSLLFAVIRDALRLKELFSQAQTIDDSYLAERPLRGDVTPKVRLNDTDNVLFADIIEGRTNVSELRSKAVQRGVSESHKLIAGAYTKLFDLIAGETNSFNDTERLIEIAEVLQEKVLIISITTATEESAYTLFETLNDRGIDLTLADLLKNYLFMKSANRLPDVQALWSDTTSTVGQGQMTQFVRYEYMSRLGKVRERELYKKLKSSITNSSESMSYIRRANEAAVVFAAFKTPNHTFWNDFPNVLALREQLRAINSLGIVQCFPLLLSAALHRKSDLLQICKWVVALTVRYSIVGGKGTGNLETVYAKAGPVARTDASLEQIRGIFRELYVPDSEFESAFALRRFSEVNIVRYILSELEKAASGQSELDASQMLTVEHVLPRRPSEAWPPDMRAPAKVNELVNRLGNLTLLTGEVNSSISNGSFDSKREVFSRSGLTLTRDLASNTFWDESTIDDRQLALAALAKSHWRI